METTPLVIVGAYLVAAGAAAILLRRRRQSMTGVRRPSSCSLVLRFRTEAACHGELVGQVEVVDTGEVVAVRGTTWWPSCTGSPPSLRGPLR